VDLAAASFSKTFLYCLFTDIEKNKKRKKKKKLSVVSDVPVQSEPDENSGGVFVVESQGEPVEQQAKC